MQTADCRPDTKCRLGTKCRLQIVEWVQNTDCESKELFCLVGDNMSCYLHYCGIFLARFLIKIDLNIISNLHIVFSLCTRVGWSDVCTDFTNLIKVDVDVDVMCKIRETINSFARGPYYYLFKRYVFILLTKMRTKAKIVPST